MDSLLSYQTLPLKIKSQLAASQKAGKRTRGKTSSACTCTAPSPSTHFSPRPAENLPEGDLEKLRKYLIAEIQK